MGAWSLRGARWGAAGARSFNRGWAACAAVLEGLPHGLSARPPPVGPHAVVCAERKAPAAGGRCSRGEWRQLGNQGAGGQQGGSETCCPHTLLPALRHDYGAVRAPGLPRPQTPGRPCGLPRPGTGTWGSGRASVSAQRVGRRGARARAAIRSGPNAGLHCSALAPQQAGMPCTRRCPPADVQVHALLVQQVLQAAGRRDDHVHAALQQVHLGPHVNAADAQHGAQLREAARLQHAGVVCDDLVRLVGQLAAGADDQALGVGMQGFGADRWCQQTRPDAPQQAVLAHHTHAQAPPPEARVPCTGAPRRGPPRDPRWRPAAAASPPAAQSSAWAR